MTYDITDFTTLTQTNINEYLEYIKYNNSDKLILQKICSSNLDLCGYVRYAINCIYQNNSNTILLDLLCDNKKINIHDLTRIILRQKILLPKIINCITPEYCSHIINIKYKSTIQILKKLELIASKQIKIFISDEKLLEYYNSEFGGQILCLLEKFDITINYNLLNNKIIPISWYFHKNYNKFDELYLICKKHNIIITQECIYKIFTHNYIIYDNMYNFFETHICQDKNIDLNILLEKCCYNVANVKIFEILFNLKIKPLEYYFNILIYNLHTSNKNNISIINTFINYGCNFTVNNFETFLQNDFHYEYITNIFSSLTNIIKELIIKYNNKYYMEIYKNEINPIYILQIMYNDHTIDAKTINKYIKTYKIQPNNICLQYICLDTKRTKYQKKTIINDLLNKYKIQQ